MTPINSEAPMAATIEASKSTNHDGNIDMTSLAIADRTINVPFYGNSLFVVEHNGEPYTPMRPIIDGMEMDWASQFTKLKSRFAKGVVEITIPTAGGVQKMICLALRKLAAWLNSISPNKVRPEIRDKVIRYQEECDDVLYEYWTNGQAVNPRAKPQEKITPEQREVIKQLVLSRGKALPRDRQAKAMITMWSALKTHFGVTYKEIQESQFSEALSLVARVSLEGEYIGREETLPDKKMDLNYPVEWWDKVPGSTPERRITKPNIGGGCQFPVRLLFGPTDESPSAINELINKLTSMGYDMSAIKMEYLAHRHYAELMYYKLSRIAEQSRSVLGSRVTMNINTSA